MPWATYHNGNFLADEQSMKVTHKRLNRKIMSGHIIIYSSHIKRNAITLHLYTDIYTGSPINSSGDEDGILQENEATAITADKLAPFIAKPLACYLFCIHKLFDTKQAPLLLIEINWNYDTIGKFHITCHTDVLISAKPQWHSSGIHNINNLNFISMSQSNAMKGLAYFC